jgi:hypothetical protein
MKVRLLSVLIIVFVCFSCRNSSNKSAEFVFPEADSVPVSEAEKLSPEAIADISRNISSPVSHKAISLHPLMLKSKAQVLTKLLNWEFLVLISDI